MQKLIAVLLALAFVACGESPTSTEADGKIVDLVLDADSITFVQTGVDLTESLYGITSEGDTVYNPDGVTFELPDGFTRDGNVIRATREAAGMVVANLNPSDSVLMRSAHHLDSLAPWSHTKRCYQSDGRQRRTGSDTLLYLDSLVYAATVDSIAYIDEPHKLPVEGYGTGTAYWFWEDGVVDTATYDRVIGFEQSGVDTVTASAEKIPAVSRSPRTYRHPATDSGESSPCGGWVKAGEWVLEQG